MVPTDELAGRAQNTGPDSRTPATHVEPTQELRPTRAAGAPVGRPQASASKLIGALRGLKAIALARATSRAIAKLSDRVPFTPLSFLALVAAPGLAVFLYFVFMASDQYVAEARFAVRLAPNVQVRDAAAGASQGLGFGGMPQLAGQDAYIVADYLKSRAVLTDISPKIDIAGVYQRPEADFWARLKADPSVEELEAYWRSKVSTAVDGPSGIVTLTVRAFRPDDAQRLASLCLEASELLVNSLSQRARKDQVQKAEEEVRRAEAQLRQALTDLRQLRDKQGFIDPLSAAKSASQLLLAALSERAKLQSDLFVLSRAMVENAPTTKVVRDRLDSIDAQITQLRSQLTNQSEEATTISAALVAYEELDLRRVFAEKLHVLSQNLLERARAQAQQQQVYVSVFVPPARPEEAKYPERFIMSGLIAGILLMLWSIMTLTIAAVRDHLR
jgi:capsular polysaccharide transport system permease protein